MNAVPFVHCLAAGFVLSLFLIEDFLIPRVFQAALRVLYLYVRRHLHTTNYNLL